MRVNASRLGSSGSSLAPRIAVVAFALGAPAAVACSSFAPVDGPADAAPDAEAGGSDVVIPDAGPVADAPPDVPVPCDSSAGRGCDERFVFATRPIVRGGFADDMPAQVLARADAFCANEARDLPNLALGGRQWKAFLCTDKGSAVARVATGAARWIRPDGVVLWDTSADLLKTEAPLAPLAPAGTAWTGCNGRGLAVANLTCSNWSTSTGEGSLGDIASSSPAWAGGTTRACSEVASLLCFEDMPQ